MESLALNYLEIATIDSVSPNSCTTKIYGCQDALAFNFNSEANIDTDPDSCEEVVYGCTDTTMINYNILANTSSDSIPCIPFRYGCTDDRFVEYDSLNNTHVQDSCDVLVQFGCTDPDCENLESEINPCQNLTSKDCPYNYNNTMPDYEENMEVAISSRL